MKIQFESGFTLIINPPKKASPIEALGFADALRRAVAGIYKMSDEEKPAKRSYHYHTQEKKQSIFKKILAMRQQGMSNQKIGLELGYSKNYVYSLEKTGLIPHAKDAQ